MPVMTVEKWKTQAVDTKPVKCMGCGKSLELPNEGINEDHGVKYVCKICAWKLGYQNE